MVHRALMNVDLRPSVAIVGREPPSRTRAATVLRRWRLQLFMNRDEFFQMVTLLLELVPELDILVLQLLQKALLVEGESKGGQHDDGK